MHFDVDPQLRRKSGFGPCLHNHFGIHLLQTHHYHYGNERSQHLLIPTETLQIEIFPTHFHFLQVRLDFKSKSNQTRHHYIWYRREIDFSDIQKHINMEVFQACAQRIDLWKKVSCFILVASEYPFLLRYSFDS